MEKKINAPYKDAPLIMALVDISYSEIPNFEKSFDIEDLAESLFKLGFTEREKINHNGIEIEVNDSAPLNVDKSIPKINTRNISRSHWVLLNIGRTVALHILSDKIILKVTDYTTFENFNTLLNSCISACSRSITLLADSPLKRVGVRYIDLLVPKITDDINDYINSEWHAPKSFIEKSNKRKLLVNKMIQFYQEENMKVKVESTQFLPEHGANIGLIPEDLADDEKVALNLKFAPWMQESMSQQKSYTLLDVDAFVDKDLGKLNAGLYQHVLDLRNLIRSSFESYITNKAESAWSN